MNEKIALTPNQLLDIFRNRRIPPSREAIADFKKLDKANRASFLAPAVEFLKTEPEDAVRSWGSEVLEGIGGEAAFTALAEILENADEAEKQTYRYTRFFALKSLKRIAATELQEAKVLEIAQRIAGDKKEQGNIWSESLLLLAKSGDRQQEGKLRDQLRNHGERNGYWGCLTALRALREFPLPRLADDVLAVIRESDYLDLGIYAIKALRHPEYSEEIKVIRALGEVVLTDLDRATTLEAIKTLSMLNRRDAVSDLFQALTNTDAEVRLQAAHALNHLLTPEEAVSTIVQRALSQTGEIGQMGHLVEALRRIDPDRKIAVDLLSSELAGQDQARAQTAERILIDLGGWAAVHKLSQRRNTLETLDRLLAESEKAVKDTFNDTIVQAQRNFYFALAVNILVVLTGVTLIVLAILQLIQQPDRLETWLVPGGAGVIGILINLAFNNPRNNARQDLATLMNVNVIFLGFLRALNQIDATFKHAYLESDDFDIKQMGQTVERIEQTMSKTLEQVANHLRAASKD